MLTCKDASRLISERQEHSLGFRARWGLRLHLWLCANCRRFERQLHLLRRALRNLAAQTDETLQIPSLTPDARERIRHAIVEHEGHSH